MSTIKVNQILKDFLHVECIGIKSFEEVLEDPRIAGKENTIDYLVIRQSPELTSLDGIEICSVLRELHVQFAGITSLNSLASLKDLMVINISYCDKLSSDLSGVPPSVTSLEFISCDLITSIDIPTELENLEILSFNGCPIATLSGLSNISKPLSLDLEGCPADFDLPQLPVGTKVSIDKVNMLPKVEGCKWVKNRYNRYELTKRN